MRGFYPDDTYDGSHDTVAALVYAHRDTASYLEAVRRLFFSYAVGTTDMHLKNVSLIYRDPRRPVIAPAYDLVCVHPYLGDRDGHELGLRLGRSRRAERVSPVSFQRLAERIKAPVDATLEAVAAVARALPGAWHEVADPMSALPGHRAWLDERIGRVSATFS